jgi:hypothetical protein
MAITTASIAVSCVAGNLAVRHLRAPGRPFRTAPGLSETPALGRGERMETGKPPKRSPRAVRERAAAHRSRWAAIRPDPERSLAFRRSEGLQFRKAGQGDARRAMDFVERPILNSSHEHPLRHRALDADGRPTNRVIDRRRLARPGRAGPEAEEGAQQRRQARRNGPRSRRRPLDPDAGVQSDRDQQSDPERTRNLAFPARPRAVAGHARNGPAATALAPSRIPGNPPLLLPDRGRGDGGLAGRGRSQGGSAGLL